jgi:hypothetical protein
VTHGNTEQQGKVLWTYCLEHMRTILTYDVAVLDRPEAASSDLRHRVVFGLLDAAEAAARADWERGVGVVTNMDKLGPGPGDWRGLMTMACNLMTSVSRSEEEMARVRSTSVQLAYPLHTVPTGQQQALTASASLRRRLDSLSAPAEEPAAADPATDAAELLMVTGFTELRVKPAPANRASLKAKNSRGSLRLSQSVSFRSGSSGQPTPLGSPSGSTPRQPPPNPVFYPASPRPADVLAKTTGEGEESPLLDIEALKRGVDSRIHSAEYRRRRAGPLHSSEQSARMGLRAQLVWGAALDRRRTLGG